METLIGAVAIAGTAVVIYGIIKAIAFQKKNAAEFDINASKKGGGGTVTGGGSDTPPNPDHNDHPAPQ